MNEEVKGQTSSSKQQEDPPEPKNSKQDIILEHMKREVKRAALEWDNFVIQEQLKPLIYVDCSLRGDPMKEKLIDELNFKNCLHLRRKEASKFFVGITLKI